MNSNIYETEEKIKECNIKIKLAESLEKLEKLPYFNFFINTLMDTSFLVQELGSKIITQEERNNIIHLLTGIGTLQNYINSIKIESSSVKQEKLNHENHLTNLRAEYVS